MRKVITAIDDVVGKVQFQTDGAVVTEVAVSAGITCVEDRTDRKYVGGWHDHASDVTTVELRNADTFYGGASNAEYRMQVAKAAGITDYAECETPQRWSRSNNALEFGPGKDFVYVSDGTNGRTKTVRIYGEGGSNTAVRITWLPLKEDDGYGRTQRVRLELWRNSERGKGRLLKVKELDGYESLGYDRSVSAGYELHDQAIRVVMFWLAFAAYGN